MVHGRSRGIDLRLDACSSKPLQIAAAVLLPGPLAALRFPPLAKPLIATLKTQPPLHLFLQCIDRFRGADIPQGIAKCQIDVVAGEPGMRGREVFEKGFLGVFVPQ